MNSFFLSAFIYSLTFEKFSLYCIVNIFIRIYILIFQYRSFGEKTSFSCYKLGYLKDSNAAKLRFKNTLPTSNDILYEHWIGLLSSLESTRKGRTAGQCDLLVFFVVPAMQSDKKWLSALWLNAMYSSKK